VEMESPKISLKLRLPKTKTEEKPPENPLALVRQLIENPPVALKIDRVSVQDAEIDLRILENQNELNLKASDINFTASVLSGSKRLKAEIEVAVVPKVQRVSTEQSNLNVSTLGFSQSVKKAEFNTLVNFQLRTGLELDFSQSTKPQFVVESFAVGSDFNSLKLKSDFGSQGRVSIDANELSADVSLPVRTTLSLQKIFELESREGSEFVETIGNAIFQSLRDFSISTKQSLKWKAMKVAANLAKHQAQFEIGSQTSFEMDLAINENEIQLSSASSGFEFIATTLLATAPALESSTDLIQLGKLSFLKLSSPFVFKLSKPEFLSLDAPLKGVRVTAMNLAPKVFINNKNAPVLEGDVKLSQGTDGIISVNADSTLDLSEELVPPFPAMKAVFAESGLFQVKSTAALNLDTKEGDIDRIVNSDSLNKSVLNFDFGVQVKQRTLPPAGSKLALQLKDSLELLGKGRVQQIVNPSSVGLTALLNIGKVQLADVRLQLDNKRQMLSSSGNAQLTIPLSVREVSPLLNDLAKLGGFKVNAQWNARLPHSHASALQLDFSKVERLKPELQLKGQLNIAEKATQPLFDKQLLLIDGPIDFSSNVALSSGQVQLDAGFAFPLVGTSALVLVKGVSGKAQLRTSLPFQNVVHVKVDAAVQELNPDKSLRLPPESLPYLKNVKARLSAKVDLQGAADVETVDVSTGNDLVFLKAQGGSDLNIQNSRFSGNVDFKLPSSFRYGIRSEDKVDFGGRVRADWEATQKELKSLRLRGTLNLDDFTARHSLVEIEKVKGSVPFEQMLESPDLKSLRWSYLISDNPFKRVDTSKFTPLTADDSLFTVERISLLGRRFGPMRARVSLKQNMLNVDKLDAEIFEGVLAGQAFIDIQPSNFMTGVQGRITKLNTSLLSKSKNPLAPAPLSARLSLMLDLSRSLIEGRADVTEIGKNQLLAFIDVLDPDGVDSLLNKARLGLGVGYPRYVGLMMQNGFLDMNVALGGVVEQNVEIKNLPLSPIVNAKTQDIVKMMREVPIQ
ncbi:MAG: hypothetical protein RJB13_2247, partial [Pseudomonadota bacterium]